jgi:hypothetical protein
MIARLRLFTLLLLAIASISVQGRAEDIAGILQARLAECAVRQEGGSWVPKDLSADGALRFTYLYEPPKQSPGEYDYTDKMHYVYAAFWNRARTKGEMLQFLWFRGESPMHLRIINNAHIVTQKGRLNLEDALWGVWTYEHLMRRLAKLKIAPLQTVAVHEIQSSRATCDSYAHVHAGSASASPPRP